jgi:hypothetical protein
MLAPANENCCRPAQKSWFHSTVSALKPIHNFAINIARTCIHGSTDLVEVLFTTPLRETIVIILPVRKHIAPGNRIVYCTLQWRINRRINIHSWVMVCARAGIGWK